MDVSSDPTTEQMSHAGYCIFSTSVTVSDIVFLCDFDAVQESYSYLLHCFVWPRNWHHDVRLFYPIYWNFL